MGYDMSLKPISRQAHVHIALHTANSSEELPVIEQSSLYIKY